MEIVARGIVAAKPIVWNKDGVTCIDKDRQTAILSLHFANTRPGYACRDMVARHDKRVLGNLHLSFSVDFVTASMFVPV